MHTAQGDADEGTWRRDRRHGAGTLHAQCEVAGFRTRLICMAGDRDDRAEAGAQRIGNLVEQYAAGGKNSAACFLEPDRTGA